MRNNGRGMMAVAGALAMTMMLAATAASAATVSECQDKIGYAQTALDAVEIGGGNPYRTRASLESKLEGASVKLDEYKGDDAYLKLVDFNNKIEDLNTPNKKGQTKISDGDYGTVAELIAAGQAAEDCVADLLGM